MATSKREIYYPHLVSAQSKALDTDVLQIIEIEETRIVSCASELAADFIRHKKSIHARIKNEPGNLGKMLFSPLMLVTRYHCGSLQVIWKETHHVKHKNGEGHWKKHILLPRGRYGRYSIKLLQKSAGYASEIVEEYEQRATEIRERWQQLMTFKKDTYAAIRRLPVAAPDALNVDASAGQASMDAVSIDTLIRKPAPEPILSPDKPRNRQPPAPSGPRSRIL